MHESGQITSIVVWKWTDPKHERGTSFLPDYYNILYAMLARHITLPWELVCVTDDPTGLRPEIRVVMDPTNVSHARSPHGELFPSCYRRLWNFSAEAANVLGPRILAIDVDVIVTGNIDHLLTRAENFVGWVDRRFVWRKVAGGLYFHKPGTMTHIWDEFDPEKSPAEARKARCFGSDQGWLSYRLYPPTAGFTAADGLAYLKWLSPDGPAPGTTVVSTPGALKPWCRQAQKRYPWIKDYWRE